MTRPLRLESGGLYLNLPDLSGLKPDELRELRRALEIGLSRTSPAGEEVRLAKFGGWRGVAQRLWTQFAHCAGQIRLSLVPQEDGKSVTLPMNRHAVGLEISGSHQPHNIDWSHGGETPYAVHAEHAASTLLSIRP